MEVEDELEQGWKLELKMVSDLIYWRRMRWKVKVKAPFSPMPEELYVLKQRRKVTAANDDDDAIWQPLLE